jgi:hypothetical protein
VQCSPGVRARPRPRDAAARTADGSGAERRALLASLFSKSAEFYERLGFRSVPLDEVTVTVKRKDGSPAMLVRSGEERDPANLSVMLPREPL